MLNETLKNMYLNDLKGTKLRIIVMCIEKWNHLQRKNTIYGHWVWGCEVWAWYGYETVILSTGLCVNINVIILEWDDNSEHACLGMRLIQNMSLVMNIMSFKKESIVLESSVKNYIIDIT